MTPVGASSPRAAENGGPPRRDLRILELSGKGALIETEEGYRRVKVGDEIPDIGKIISIRSMGHYWVLVASLRSVAQEAPPEAIAK